jgi:hypothetical protein
MNNSFILAIMLSLASSCIAIGTAIYLHQRSKRNGRTGINGAATKSIEESPVDGVTFSVGRYKHLLISVKMISECEFQMSKEGRIHKVARKKGFSSELQTGDKEFDNEIFITCEDAQTFSLLFGTPEVRQLVRELFQAPIFGFEMALGKLEVKISRYLDCEDDSTLNSVLPKLAAFVKKVESLPPPIVKTKKWFGLPFQKMHFIFCLAGLLIAPIFYIVGVTNMLDKWQLLQDSLYVSLPLVVVLMSMTKKLFSKRSDYFRNFLASMFLATPALVIFVFGLAGVINGAFDESGPQVREVAIVGKYINHGKRNSKSHYARFQYPSENSHSAWVTASEFNRITIGKSKLEIGIYDGFLGYPWYRVQKVID